MIKTKIIETTEKYDENGTLIEKITREETTEDDETRYPVVVPSVPNKPWEPYCNVTCTSKNIDGSPII